MIAFITANGFTDFITAANDVKYIIGNLKCQTKLFGILRQRCKLLFISTSQPGA